MNGIILLKTILMDKKLHETTSVCVEIMNSKRQVKGKFGHVVQIHVCRFTARHRYYNAWLFNHILM